MNIINKLKRETILTASGCRVNGGGANRMLVVTLSGTYIFGARTLLTLVGKEMVPESEYQNAHLIGVYTSTPMVDADDLLDAKYLESDGYNGCYVNSIYVAPTGMKQFELVIKKEK